MIRMLAALVLLVTPAGAQECKEIINAAGSATLMGEGAAMRSAITNWQRDVIAKWGSQWMQWEKAADKVHDCGPASVGTLGRYMIRCTLAARPCGGNLTVVAEEPERPVQRPVEIDDPLACEDYPESVIRRVQGALNACRACDRRIKVDGKCGAQTERCLRVFQRERGIRVTSLPDRATIIALRDFCERN